MPAALLQEQRPKLDLPTPDWGCTRECSVTDYDVIIEHCLLFRTARVAAAPAHFRSPNLWGIFNRFFLSSFEHGHLGTKVTGDLPPTEHDAHPFHRLSTADRIISVPGSGDVMMHRRWSRLPSRTLARWGKTGTENTTLVGHAAASSHLCGGRNRGSEPGRRPGGARPQSVPILGMLPSSLDNRQGPSITSYREITTRHGSLP